MFHEPDTYTVNVIFRGLFLAWVEKGSVTVYLPNAKGLVTSELNPEIEIRDHSGALEFQSENWVGRKAFKDTVQVKKAKKGRVTISWLNGHEVAFRSKNGTLRAPSPPKTWTDRCNTKYPQDPNGRLWILDDHPKNEFQHLVRFKSALNPNIQFGTELVGRVVFQEGFVQSERRSTWFGAPVRWLEVEKEDVEKALTDEMSWNDLGKKYGPGRYINLDLRVTLVADEGDPLIVELVSQGGARRTFELQPVDSEESTSSLDVWVKNREEKAILEESDLLDESPPNELDVIVDIDHEAYKMLRKDGLASVVIPCIAPSGDADQGAGCGGTGNGP